jgi:hypothetical protein
MEIPQELIDQVEAAAGGLYEFSGVTGVGIGLREENGEFLDELAVRVLVADLNDPPQGLPEAVGDLPLCLVEFPVEPLFAPDVQRYDPLLGGAQIEQAPAAAGTLAALALDSSGTLVGLTCHHVAGDPGTTLWQPFAPPTIAGGAPPDPVDSLGAVLAGESPATQTIPVPAGGLLVLGRPLDAAVLALDAAQDPGTGNRGLSPGVTDGFGEVDATASPEVKTFVRKRGSQTGPTSGLVIGVLLIVDWSFGTPPPGHSYVMNRQYEVFFDPTGCPDGIFSRGGDSGSLVLQKDSQTAVGLLWGGVRAGGIRAVMSDITIVESRLGVTLVWAFQ